MIFRHLLNILSHPTWVRGLKLDTSLVIGIAYLSHPTWVRGLKQNRGGAQYQKDNVAPYVGAWIETFNSSRPLYIALSHPTWVRGLKRRHGRRCKRSGVSHPTWVRGLKR